MACGVWMNWTGYSPPAPEIELRNAARDGIVDVETFPGLPNSLMGPGLIGRVRATGNRRFMW